MKQKLSRLLERAVGAQHRPCHKAKLERALQEVRQEEAERETKLERLERARWTRRYRW